MQEKKFDPRGYIEYDPRENSIEELVIAVYELSKAQGMGFLHFQEGGLDADFLNRIVTHAWRPESPNALNLDYVSGRACKFNLRRDENGKYWFQARWYDHTDWHIEQLLMKLNPSLGEADARRVVSDALKSEREREIERVAKQLANRAIAVEALKAAGGSIVMTVDSPEYDTFSDGQYADRECPYEYEWTSDGNYRFFMRETESA